MKRPIIIDTDMQADDALALLLAVASAELDIRAVTCIAGRDSVEVVTQNTLRVLQLAGAPDIAVAAGATKPLLAKSGTGRILGQKSPWNRLSGAVEKHMPSAESAPHEKSAADLILSLTNEQPGDVSIVALGPLTNIALCLIQDDSFAQKVSQVVIMGGSLFVPGNSAPGAETNFYADPEAARMVFESDLPIVMVGLDVTTQVLMTPRHLDGIRTSRLPSVKRFIDEIITSSESAQQSIRKLGGFPMHDPLAVAVAFDSSFVTTQQMFVAIETRGELTSGCSVGDPRNVLGNPPNAEVCLNVDADRFLKFYVERISNGY